MINIYQIQGKQCLVYENKIFVEADQASKDPLDLIGFYEKTKSAFCELIMPKGIKGFQKGHPKYGNGSNKGKHWKGKAKFCENCGKIGEKVGDRWNIDWANIDHKYRRVLEDYIGLCKKCHRKYDK